MMKKLNRAYKLLMDYSIDYKYSFKEEDIARAYPHEEEMRKRRENRPRIVDSISEVICLSSTAPSTAASQTAPRSFSFWMVVIDDGAHAIWTNQRGTAK